MVKQLRQQRKTSNQDIYDICVQEYGTLEFLGKLIDENNLNFSAIIQQGQELTIDNGTNGNADVKDFFELKDKKQIHCHLTSVI